MAAAAACRAAIILNPSPFPANLKRSHRVKFNISPCAQISDSNSDKEELEENTRLKKTLKINQSQPQSSWSVKNSEGKDYLYRLGQEADNTNVTVGARQGLIDDLFVGEFLGKDADIVFDYRQKVTRSFEHLQGDYYIAPTFMEKIVLHIVKNYIAHLLDAKVPLILGNTQVTVNNQIVIGTLMNLADNPTRVSIGQDWRESDITNRVPIIVTGNDFSTLYAPLIRDGRMEKFDWQPTREDLINIVHRMYQNDSISKEEVARIVDSFPNQALDFYGALRSRACDHSVLKWIEDIGGAEKL